MKRVIRRTKGERMLRKELYVHLLDLGIEVFTSLGDTERRIQRGLNAPSEAKTSFAKHRLLCKAAWLHPAGSALMYLHYRFVSMERRIPLTLERWDSKLMLSTHFLASEAYGGRWSVCFTREKMDALRSSIQKGHTELASWLDVLLSVTEGNSTKLSKVRH